MASVRCEFCGEVITAGVFFKEVTDTALLNSNDEHVADAPNAEEKT